MARRSRSWSYIEEVLCDYNCADETFSDVVSVLTNYGNLTMLLDSFVFNDATTSKLANFKGTIPISYKGKTYYIPICIWMLKTYPRDPPLAYVEPTACLRIRPTRYIDNDGRIYLPYLQDWTRNDSNLMGLIQMMIMDFEKSPPVYSTIRLQAASLNAPCPSPPTSIQESPTINPQYDTIGRSFVSKYYTSFKDVAELANFYNEEKSMMTFEGQQIIGRTKIMEKIQGFALAKVSLNIIDIQPMVGGGIFIYVVGQLKVDNNSARTFNHTLIWTTLGGSYYIEHDIFRFADA